MLNARWIFAVWFPFAVVSCAAAAYVFFAADDGLPMASGPGGGGEGIYFLIVWFLRLLALAALVACYFLRPRGKAWNLKAVVISAMLWGLIFTVVAVIDNQTSGITVSVRAADTTGRPLSGVSIKYRWSNRPFLGRFKEDHGSAVADANGMATFRIPTFDSLYVYGDRELRPTHEVAVYCGNGWCTVLHSKDGVSGSNTYSTTAPLTSELNVSIQFDPAGGVPTK